MYINMYAWSFNYIFIEVLLCQDLIRSNKLQKYKL